MRRLLAQLWETIKALPAELVYLLRHPKEFSVHELSKAIQELFFTKKIEKETSNTAEEKRRQIDGEYYEFLRRKDDKKP